MLGPISEDMAAQRVVRSAPKSGSSGQGEPIVCGRTFAFFATVPQVSSVGTKVEVKWIDGRF